VPPHSPYATPPGPFGGPAYHLPGTIDPTAGGVIHVTPSPQAQAQASAMHGAGWTLGQALIHHLTTAGNYGVGGGPTGPPVQAPPGLPYGYPNLQSVVDYMRGIY
jgi:hypothetical protein